MFYILKEARFPTTKDFFKGTQKIQTMSKVTLQDTIQDVYVISSGKKRKVEARTPKTVSLYDGDEIITGKNSYVINLSDSSLSGVTTLSMAPNSHIKLKIKGKRNIDTTTVKKGLCQLMTPSKIDLDWVKLNYLMDADFIGWIEKSKDKMNIAQKSGYTKITHKKTGKSVELKPDQQITVDSNNISKEIQDIDKKYFDFFKKYQEVSQKSYDLYEKLSSTFGNEFVKIMEKNIKETEEYIKEVKADGRSTKALKAQLAIMKKELINAKEENKKNKENQTKKQIKRKEASEFQKKFDKQQKKFEKDLANMSKEIENQSFKEGSSDDGVFSDLDKKIQSLNSGIEEESEDETDNSFSDLEKKIQNASKDLDNE